MRSQRLCLRIRVAQARGQQLIVLREAVTLRPDARRFVLENFAALPGQTQLGAKPLQRQRVVVIVTAAALRRKKRELIDPRPRVL